MTSAAKGFRRYCVVISDGCLNAMTIAIYSGNAMVISPINRRIVMGQFTFDFHFLIHYNCSSFLLDMDICATEIATITMKNTTALAL